MITTINEWKIFEAAQEKWYHGSDSAFTDFEHRGTRGPSALGIFATTDPELAEMFGSNVYEVEINYSNPYTISQDKWDSIRSKYAGNKDYFSTWRQELISAGYDALFIQERNWTASSGHTFRDPKIIAIFDPKGIKMKQHVNEGFEVDKYAPKFTDGTMESDGCIYGEVHLIDTVTNKEAGELEYIVCSDHIYLEYIRIWDDYRNLGLSKLLYDAFEQHIKKYNKKLIKLDAQPLDKIEEGDLVDGDMIRLVNMYRRFGFQIDNNGPAVDSVSTPMYKNL